MVKKATIKMYHPETGAEILLQTEAQAAQYLKSGWQYGSLPSGTVGNSKEEKKSTSTKATSSTSTSSTSINKQDEGGEV